MDKFIQKLMDAIEEGTQNAVNKTAELFEDESKRQAPVDTGRLRDSIYTVKKANYLADVITDSPYAKYVIHGTGSYGKGAGNKSGWVYNVTDSSSKYYGWHHTKGQKPNNFPQRAFNSKKGEVHKIVLDEIRKALSKL